MTEPTDEEMERAERIRKLRTGGARSRSQEVREQRRQDATGDRDQAPSEDADGAGEPAPGSREEELEAAERVDVVELTEDLPADGSLFVVPVTESLRREFRTVAEELHLQYGFTFDRDLDAERHLRPLALYLGIKTLEGTDVEVVDELLSSVDALEAPGDER